MVYPPHIHETCKKYVKHIHLQKDEIAKTNFTDRFLAWLSMELQKEKAIAFAEENPAFAKLIEKLDCGIKI